MEIGLALPQFDFSVHGECPLRWDTVIAWAQRAELLGFGSVWLADHLAWSIEQYGAAPGRWQGYEPLAVLAGLARATSRVRLGTLVLVNQLRPAAVLTKAVATIDVLSGGRMTVGLGAGWFEPDFTDAGIPFERPGVRLAQLAEAIQVVKGLSAGGPFTFEGRFHRAAGARCLPPSVQQPAPPVWVGGKGDRLLELCARHADGWNTVWTWTIEDWRVRAAVLDAACERVGREPATVARSVGLYTLVGENEADLQRQWRRLQELSPPGVVDGVGLADWRKGHLVGTVEEVAEQLAGWKAAGVTSIVANLGTVPFGVGQMVGVDALATACTLVEP